MSGRTAPNLPDPWWRRNLSGLVVVFVAVVVVAGFVGYALHSSSSDDGASDSPSLMVFSAASVPPPPPATTKREPTAPTAAASGKPATVDGGTVVTVVAPGQWTVAVTKGVNLSVVTTAATTFAGGKSAADVKKGSTVDIKGTLAEGVITATSVTIGKKAS